jgi:hypothetical protein
MVENHWMLDVPLPLLAADVLDCVVLWAAVESVPYNETLEDVFTWSCSASGNYSAKSTYDHLSKGGTQFPLSDGIWKSNATPRCKDFMWHALKRRLWTADRCTRRGLQDQTSPCFVCLQEEDTADHILCNASRPERFGMSVGTSSS